MFLFPYNEDSLRLLEEDRKREERRSRFLRELRELRSNASPTHRRQTGPLVAAPRTTAYTGPERRRVPCPEMKEAMTP